MPAPAVAAAGSAALKFVARAVTAYAAKRAAGSAWNWKGPLALALGAATFFAVSLCSGIGTALQNSTLPWPVVVPEAGKEAQGWIAGGWQVSSAYGWRSDPFDPQRKEFHDGIDLAGPPFCLHCRLPSLFDAQVRYLGWDPYRDRKQPADKSGGGMVVELETLAGEQAGDRDGELVATYAHLAPYRLLVQLQGRIDDPWQREDYAPYADYQELGGEQLPAPDQAALQISCTAERERYIPEFVAQQAGPATFVFLYDKPVVAPSTCSVSMSWPAQGDGWTGWVPDDPPAGPEANTAAQEFHTPMEQMVQAGDVAIRFRAHLTPPAPPPTPLPYPAPGDPGPPYPAPAQVSGSHPPAVEPPTGGASGAGEGCKRSAIAVSCRWTLAALRQAQPAGRAAVAREPAELPGAKAAATLPAAGSLGSAQDHNDERCGRIQLEAVPARAQDPRMTPDAAAAWHRADRLIREALGYAWLGVYPSDIMRPVTHVPTKGNQILASWHKTGRAVDVPQSGRNLRVVREGAYQRLFVDGVDITALMVRAGFTRIPSDPGRPEWWHFEYQGGMSWQGAMAQLYPIGLLERLYPMFDWSAFACHGDGTAYPAPGDGRREYEQPYPTCNEGVPTWSVRYEELDGCGPPLLWSSEIQTLDHVIGHVGLTGATTAAHLHLGLRQRSGSPANNSYPLVDVCEPQWLPEELRGLSREEVNRIVRRTWKADCYTGTVDPLDFLPRANAGAPLPLATAAPLDGEPAQLPPPGTDGALLRPAAPDEPGSGEYWSPYRRWSRFGGGGVLEWLRSILCSWLGDWIPFCASS